MTLTYAFSPEGIILAVGKDGVGVKAVEREHTWIPADGYYGYLAALSGCVIHSFEMLWNVGVSVKAVDHVEVRRKGGSHFRQVGGAASADNQHVDVVFVACDLRGGKNLCFGKGGFDRFGRSAGKYPEKIIRKCGRCL